ncbi:FAD-binding oxidoreductase [Herbaspirillum sp. SJZ099]|uniref:NAD(P)/FAD-dependent oxidoreductase n=1 Tax=Herbaspirillum sp. SJZ099 TaxID=2572916 RepID=UPI0011AC816B|nr:FAD-dependent oxidoreductase [Herbaspirillum sp. SJZ099]TWC62394.1 D-amino-acid dehydrogenase [Herbaspirillum sp. SJZ099]
MQKTIASNNSADVVVVGAGIIGVACALQLARKGLLVTVVDRQQPGLGASYGNAGHLATEQVFPIADSSILKRIPAMLRDPMGPLRLDWRYLPRALPWFVRLLLNLQPSRYLRTVAGIRALNEASCKAWRRLLGNIDATDLLKEDGSLLVYERGESFEALETLQARMAQQGVEVDFWQEDEIRKAVPQLSKNIRGGLFFPKTGHFIDPYLVVTRLVEAAKAFGVQFEQREVLDAKVTETGVRLFTPSGELAANQVLVACGAHSAKLTASLTGKNVPLDTERGYHLMLPAEQERLPFAVTSFERKFIMTPMRGGLRLAGTVEFAGLKRPPNMERAWQLHKLSEGLFHDSLSTKAATHWMGFRPSIADSLPVIDSVCDGKVMMAFGHHHLGLTQAAVTAELVARLNSHLPATHDLPEISLYALSRF